MRLHLEPSDLNAQVSVRGAFPVYSLGPWRKIGEQRFTALGDFLHELKYEPLDKGSIRAGVSRLADLVLPEMRKIWPVYPAEYCVSVPPNRPRSRDIPGLLANEVCRRTRIRLRADILTTTRKVRSMKNTPRDERARELAGAYKATKPLLHERGLLVIDDVYDSGSTLRAARQALLKAGVRGPLHFFALSHIDHPNGNWQAVS